MNQTYEEPGTALSVPVEARKVAERPSAPPQLLDALRPAERVALMAEISNVVADVITKQGWFVKIHDKKYITIHGWTFVGSLAGCSVKTTGYEKIEGGYKAHASVVRVDSGVEVGSAEQVCMKNESFGRGKDDYALIGMASTRACSRALSTAFRHVVELAGYSATPAEEMNREDPPLPKSSEGRAAPSPPDPPAPSPAPLTTAELQDLARSLGIATTLDGFIAWAAEHVEPSIAVRRAMTGAEKARAKALLDAMPRAEPPEPVLDVVPDEAEQRQRRALRTAIVTNARVLWPGDTELERKRAMKLHRCGESLDDDHIDDIPLEALLSLERDLARRARGRNEEADVDDALADYAAGKLQW